MVARWNKNPTFVRITRAVEDENRDENKPTWWMGKYENPLYWSTIPLKNLFWVWVHALYINMKGGEVYIWRRGNRKRITWLLTYGQALFDGGFGPLVSSSSLCNMVSSLKPLISGPINWPYLFSLNNLVINSRCYYAAIAHTFSCLHNFFCGLYRHISKHINAASGVMIMLTMLFFLWKFNLNYGLWLCYR